MSTVFEESGWRFAFDAAEWPAVLKWDEDATYTGSHQRLCGETRRTINGCGRPGCRWAKGRSEQFVAEATRAVDFAAVGPHSRPFLIEVKHLQAGGPFEGTDERAFKIAAKVRDSICGIGFAKAKLGDVPSQDLAAVRQRLKASAKVRIVVVFDHPGSPVQTLALEKRLKVLLSWLRGDVVVVGPNADLPGLTVTAV